MEGACGCMESAGLLKVEEKVLEVRGQLFSALSRRIAKPSLPFPLTPATSSSLADTWKSRPRSEWSLLKGQISPFVLLTDLTLQ
jgi:hypothetical protein